MTLPVITTLQVLKKLKVLTTLQVLMMCQILTMLQVLKMFQVLTRLQVFATLQKLTTLQVHTAWQLCFFVVAVIVQSYCARILADGYFRCYKYLEWPIALRSGANTCPKYDRCLNDHKSQGSLFHQCHCQTRIKCCSAVALLRAEQGPCEPSKGLVSQARAL